MTPFVHGWALTRIFRNPATNQRGRVFFEMPLATLTDAVFAADVMLTTVSWS